MDPKTQLSDIHRTVTSMLQPAERRIFKLKQREPLNGNGLSLNLRLEPVYKELAPRAEGESPRTLVDYYDGGLFLEIKPQAPTMTSKGYPQLDHESPARVVAKLGMPDVSGMLAAYDAVRRRNAAVPTYLQDRRSPQPNVLSLFHQTPNGTSTAITWTFQEESSTLRLSKSKDHSQQINLTIGEELIVAAYLERAIDAFLMVGF